MSVISGLAIAKCIVLQCTHPTMTRRSSFFFSISALDKQKFTQSVNSGGTKREARMNVQIFLTIHTHVENKKGNEKKNQQG